MLRNPFANKLSPSDDGSGRQCAAVQSRLFSYLDFELDPVERSRVESHLVACGRCRSELAACRSAEAALGSAVSTVPSPGDLRSGFYARLEQSRRRRFVIGWNVAAPVLAAAAVLCAVGLARSRPGAQVTTRTGVDANPAFQQTNGQVTLNHDGAVATTGPMNVRAANEPVEKRTTGAANEYATLPNSKSRTRATFANGKTTGDGVRSRNYLARLTGLVRSPKRLVVPRHADTRLALNYMNVDHSPAFRGLRQFTDSPTRQIGGRTDQPTDAAFASRPAIGPEAARSMSAAMSQSFALSLSGSQSAQSRPAGVSLASFTTETELHVSDEDRDFMSSTKIGSAGAARDKSGAVRVDEDVDNTEESVELPALP